MNAHPVLDPNIVRKLRMVKLRKQGMRLNVIAARFGTTHGEIDYVLKKYKGPSERIRSGTFVAAGFDEGAITRVRQLTGKSDPSGADLKRYLNEDPARRYYLRRKGKHGAAIMDFAIKNLGVEPSLCDLGLSISGIRLMVELTGKKFPYKSDMKKWFEAHREEKERECIIKGLCAKVRGGSGRTGDKNVFELEQFAKVHLFGGK